jgi:hypothetical protein
MKWSEPLRMSNPGNTSEATTIMDYKEKAKRKWGKAAAWISGNGRYALLAHCRMLTVTLWSTMDAAEAAKKQIDATACGGACVRDHEILDLEGIRKDADAESTGVRSLDSLVRLLHLRDETVRLQKLAATTYTRDLRPEGQEARWRYGQMPWRCVIGHRAKWCYAATAQEAIEKAMKAKL